MHQVRLRYSISFSASWMVLIIEWLVGSSLRLMQYMVVEFAVVFLPKLDITPIRISWNL